MKIVDVTLTPVAYPAPSVLRWGRYETKTMRNTIIQVVTDEGLVGIGDAPGPIGGHRVALAGILLPLLREQNPLDVERLWAMMASGQHGGRIGDLIGGIDVALWDIVGKVANLPLYRIFGAYRNRVPAYVAPSMRRDVDAFIDELIGYRERGFRATKLRIGLGVVGWAGGQRDQTRDFETLRRAREALRNDFAIGADTDKTYDHAMTAQLAPVVQETNLAWLEEAIPNVEREQYVRQMLSLRGLIHAPLSGGQGFFSPAQFDELINLSAVDIVQPDVCHCGGLTPLRKIAAMAAGRGMSCMPHVSCDSGEDIGMLATAHALGAMPNGLWICYQTYDTPLRTDLLKEPVRFEHGEIVLPEKPGLGVEIDPTALDRLRADE